LNSHSTSCLGLDPPRRHSEPEHATEVNRIDEVEGRVRSSQCPCGVAYSATDVGPAPLLEDPMATQTSLRVQDTLVRGTSKLRAGVPLK
jgi:hypothetical protein